MAHFRLIMLAVSLSALVTVNVSAQSQSQDQRKLLAQLGKDLGWSKDTMIRIRRVTGYVACRPEEGDELLVFGSAALVGTNVTVLTAHHIFQDKSGEPYKLKECFFKPQASGSAMIPIRRDIAHARFGEGIPAKNRFRDDWAVFRLARPIQNAQPLAVDPNNFLKEGREVIGISAFQEGFKREFLEEPIAQTCTHFTLMLDKDPLPPFLQTDCNIEPGASGGPVLTEVEGQLVAVGIFSGRTYNFLGGVWLPKTGRSIAINPRIIAAIEELSDKKVIRTSIAEAPLFIPRPKDR